MSQHDMVISDGDGPTTRADFNLALAALVGLNSGASLPTTTYPLLWWMDTSLDVLRVRNASDDNHVPVWNMDQTNDLATAYLQNWEDVETVYDETVDGSVASVETSNFEDGYEYRFICQRVGSSATTGDLRVYLYGETEAAYGSAIPISFDINGSGAGEGFYGTVTMTEAREANTVFCIQGYGGVSSAAINTDHIVENGVAGFSGGPVNGGLQYFVTAQKILKVKFDNEVGNLANNGKIIMQSRRVW